VDFVVDFLYRHYFGLANLSVWGYIGVTLLMMHTTLVGVTLYYHRDQAHRAVDLHPALRHFFRFWLWLTTGACTREWVAVHRKHHAFTERAGDPHSPMLFGLQKVVLEGVELYRVEAANPETLEKYGKGTPNDWLERRVYGPWSNSGVTLLVIMNLLLFGIPGIIMIAVQLSTMPFLAAGIINGVAHAKGYRNFETNDSSTNLYPFAVLIAGEELHNNHHAFPSSAKFSMRPYEFDIGWMYLKIFSALGLAKIRRVATAPELAPTPVQPAPELDNLRAIIVHRMHVLRHFTQNVTLPLLRRELEYLGDNANAAVRRTRRMLTWQPSMLDESSRERLTQLIEAHPSLKTVMQFRAELKSLWEGAHTSNERLLADFKEWCARAEASGIHALADFVAYLKSFQAMPEPRRA
jgi:stearoyl-CoA desaturase (delta-9 desaturase)